MITKLIAAPLGLSDARFDEVAEAVKHSGNDSPFDDLKWALNNPDFDDADKMMVAASAGLFLGKVMEDIKKDMSRDLDVSGAGVDD